MAKLTLPTWMKLWFIISSLIVMADVLFVLLRPHSMKGGAYANVPFWNFYPIYYSIDRLYADMENAFVRAQSYINIVEIIGNVIGLSFFFMGRHARGLMVLLLAAQATLAKTLLYFVHEHCFQPDAANHPTAHNFPHDTWKYVVLYMLPNGMWIIFPLLIVRNLACQLLAAIPDRGAVVAAQDKTTKTE